jgi:hypothetical protein
MKYKTKLFLILWIAGITGVLSFLLVDLSALLANFPVTAGTEIPLSYSLLKLLSIIQPTVIVSLAVLVGVGLAPKVGLSAPLAESAAGGRQLIPALRPQVVPGVVGGFLGGVAIVISWLVLKPFLPPEFVTRAEELNKHMPFLTRLLYGGITEELLLRWGVMTLLVWIAWRLLQKGKDEPRAICFVSAIVLSAIVFGLGHLPLVSALGVHFTAAIVLYIVVANSAFGFIAGYLYWKKGLESAIVAHMFAHVVIVTAIHLGA